MRECEFCGAEFADVDGGAAILPKNLSLEEIQGSINNDEGVFWNETINSLDAPFFTLTPEQRNRLKRFSPSRWVATSKAAIEVMLANTVLLRGEVFVSTNELGACTALFTNYRMLVLDSGALTLIPWHQLISAKPEPFENGGRLNGFGERLVIRWKSGDSERVLDTRATTMLNTGALAALEQASEWSSLTPLERELLAVTRRSLSRHVGKQLPPIQRASSEGEIAKWVGLPDLVAATAAAANGAEMFAVIALVFGVIGACIFYAGRPVQIVSGDNTISYDYGAPQLAIGAGFMLLAAFVIRRAARARTYAKEARELDQ